MSHKQRADVDSDSVAGLASNALYHFKHNDLDQAARCLERLAVKQPNEPRISLNTLVCKFYQDAFDSKEEYFSPDKLLRELEALNKSVTSRLMQSSKGSNTVGSKQLRITKDEAHSAEVVAETDLLIYNQAVIYYHFKRYAQAAKLLRPLFERVDKLEEYLALKVCFLLVDVYLSQYTYTAMATSEQQQQQQHQSNRYRATVEKAAEVVQYLERAFGPLFSTAAPSKSLPMPSTGTISISSSQNGPTKPQFQPHPPSLPVSEAKVTLHLCRGKLLLAQRSFNAAKRDIKIALSILSSTTSSIGSGSSNSVGIENRSNASALTTVNAMLLKAHVEFHQNNIMKSVRILNSVQSRVAEYHQLQISSQTAEPLQKQQLRKLNQQYYSMLFYNSLGCVQLKLRKFDSAALCFAKAIRANDCFLPYYATNSTSDEAAHSASKGKAAVTANRGAPSSSNESNQHLSVYITSQAAQRDHRELLAYNMGLQFLLNGKPAEAYKCFREAAVLLYNRPRLWTRIAECCIAVHQQQVEAYIREGAHPHVHASIDRVYTLDGITRIDCSPVAQLANHNLANSGIGLPAVSQDPPDNLLGPSNDYSSSKLNNSFDSLPSIATYAKQLSNEMSLEIADRCLRNAYNLLQRSLTSAVPRATSTSPQSAALHSRSSSTSTEPESTQSNRSDPDSELMNHVILKLSYVSLELNNSVVALSLCKKLLAMPDCSRAAKMTALTYAAEALCHLNEPSDVLTILSKADLQSILTPTSDELQQQQQKQQRVADASVSKCDADIMHIRESLFVNMAIAAIHQNNFVRAQEFVTQLLAQSLSPNVFILQVYLLIAQGQTELAFKYLRDQKLFACRVV